MTSWAEPRHSQPMPARQARTVCAVLRAETRPGLDEEFAALIADLAHLVRNEEPGCESYVVTRVLGSREHFAVHARFIGWDAFEAHADTPHLNALMPRLIALLAAPVSMELFLEI